jgi:outer membrane protein assembly factor BamB
MSCQLRLTPGADQRRPMHVKHGVAILFLCLFSTPTSRLFADDWPHWRGPTRDGLTKESSGWKGGEWLSTDPAWSSHVGAGTSGPLIFRGRVFVIGWEGKKDVLRCLDLTTGKEEWRQSYPSPSHGRFHKGDEDLYGGPHSAPEIDTDTGLL